MKFNRNLIIATFTALLLVGCSNQQKVTKSTIQDADLIAYSHTAADKLIASAGDVLSTSQPILITSFANIDDLKSSSTFGRITGEQFGSQLSEKGYPVIEMKVRNSIFIKEQSGEFILSRELIKLSTLHDAQAILVGTYAVGKQSVYVTSKLIRTADNVVMSSYDYELPMGPNTKSLLRAPRR